MFLLNFCEAQLNVKEEEAGAGEFLALEVQENDNINCLWDENSTKLLLDEYENYYDQFRNPKIKKKDVWEKIANRFKENGYSKISVTILDQKMRNLENTYKKIKGNNKKTTTGRGRISWKYFERFEQIFTIDKTINKPALISSTPEISNPVQDEHASEDARHQIPSTSSSTSSCSSSKIIKKTRLDSFRKRQLELEEQRIEELKQIRLEIAESNKINREKLSLLQQFFKE